MPRWLKLKPRWHPLPSHQMRNEWRASGSTVRDDKSNTLCRQVAILLPNYVNLPEISFVERFCGHPRFDLLAFCPCIRRFRLICQRPSIRTENTTSTTSTSSATFVTCWTREYRLTVSVSACVCVAFLIVADDSMKTFTKLLQSNEQRHKSSTFVLN